PAQVLLLYQGNLGLAPELFADAPIERDARPWIEFGAAIAHREKRAGRAHALVGDELVSLGDALLARLAPEGDPLLRGRRARRAPPPRGGPRAGSRRGARPGRRPRRRRGRA